MTIVYSLLIGFALDFLLGDPHWLPHPVRLIGAMISDSEKLLRKVSCNTQKSRFICGMVQTIFTVLVSFAAPFIILCVLGKISVYLLVAVESLMCWQIIAAKSLKTESMKVYYELEKNDLAGARKKLSWIVGRDTQNLDEEHVIRAAVETVAENTSDGVTAPIFYVLIGGAPLGFFYKAVNTLDSMTGYKNERYIDFGKFAAKLDDAVNFIPARVTGVLMIAASFFAGLDFKNAARIFKRDRKKHHSPNSACTEAACAGALRVQLAGDSFYFGRLVKKPTIGDGSRAIEKDDIRRANTLMYLTALLFLVIGAGIKILIWEMLQ
jgi:adenosylcobinamide-phosphate synthase